KHWRGPRRWTRPRWSSVGLSCGYRVGVDNESAVVAFLSRRARLIPNFIGDTGVRPIQAIRVGQVRTSRCGLHRHRRLPRRRRLEPSLLRHRGTRG
ncbi:MAG: hypothetical protein ACYTXY_51165, partial [Nostoc sp.]